MKFKATLFALLAASTLPSHGQTTTYTWYGFGPDNNWTSNTNWSPTRPASSNTTILEFAGATRTTANNNLGDWALDLNSLNFASGASSFTLTGNSFGFRELRQIPVSDGNGGFAKSFWPQEINQNSVNPQTISTSAFAFRSDSDSFINLHEGDLTINSTVYIDSDPYNHRALTVGGNDLTRRTLNLNGTLTKGSSSGKVPQLLIRQGKRVVVNGSLALGVGGDATVTGGGRLEVGASGTLGNSYVLLYENSSLWMQDAGKNFSNSIVIGSELGSPTIGGMNSSGVVTYTGSVWSHNATPTVTGYNLAAAGGGTVEFSGSRDFNDPLFINRPDGTTPVGGTVVLSGTSTSTGPISVMGGTLSINQDNRLGASGSTAGRLTLDGATLKLTAPVAPLNAFTSSRGIVLGGGGATIDATSHPAGSNPRFSGPISGSGNLTLKASGGFDLTSPANTYVGTTTIIGCTVNISSSYAFGAAGNTVVIDGGGLVGSNVSNITYVGYDIELGAAGGFFAPGNGRSMKVDGTIKGSGSLTKMGPGKLVLAAGSIETYSGDTRVTSGTLSLGGEFMEGTGSQTPGADSGVSLLNSTVDMNAADSGVVSFASLLIAIEPATYVFGGLKGTRGINMPSCFFKVGSNHQNTTYAGTLSGPAKLIKIGTGTLTLTGVNAHGGNTEVSAGTLRLGVAETLPDAGAAGSTGGILDLGGHTETVRLGGLDAGSIVNGTLVATAGFALKSGAASAVLAGAGPLEKSGSGVATLTGLNTYSGATTVSAGTLALSGSGSIAASSNYIVNGTLDVSATPSGLLAVAVGKTLSGSGTVAGGVTVSGTVAPGGNSPGTLSTGSVTLTGTYACEITGTACDVLAVSGDFTTGATTRLEVTGTPTANRYVIATYTGSLGSLAFADSPVLPGGYDLQVDLANKQLLIVKTGATSSPYAAWSAGKSLVASLNDGATQDPDGDGTPNILEFALGGDPLAADAYLSPVVTLTADHFIFTFNRSDASELEVALDFQSGSDLASWTEVAIGASSAGSVGVVENGDAPDTVTVTLARSNQAGATLLCRLKAALKVAE